MALNVCKLYNTNRTMDKCVKVWDCGQESDLTLTQRLYFVEGCEGYVGSEWTTLTNVTDYIAVVRAMHHDNLLYRLNHWW